MELRIDTDLADTRRQFEAAARSVDELGDEFDEASDRADELGREAGRLADELEDVRREANAMGAALTDEMRDRLQAATDAARAGERAFEDATDEARRLARALDEAEDEADRLEDRLRRLDATANTGFNRARRGLAGFITGMQQAGGNASRLFADGFNGLPGGVRAAAYAAGITAGVAFATAAGAMINALMLTAVGGGMVAVGATLAAKSSAAVQMAFAETFSDMGDDAKQWATEAFEQPLLTAADKFGDAWGRVGADVRDLFADAATLVEPLADGLADLVEEVMPGLSKGMEAAKPVIEELAVGLPVLGRAISEMFESFAAGGDGAVKGMRALILVVSAGLMTVGDVIEFLSDGFDWFTRQLERATSAAEQIPVIGALFEDAAEFWREFNEPAEGGIRNLEATGPAGEQAAGGMYKAAAAAEKAADEAHKLSQEFDDLISNALGLSNAAIAWEAAFDDVTTAIKENGRQLDIGTDKGRQNVSAINAAVEAAEQMRLKAIENAGGQNASAAAVQAANDKYRQQIGALEQVLLKMGFTKAQVDQLLAAYREIPSNINTTITVERKLLGPALGPQFGFRGFATGGTPPPGWAWVGEKGPELIDFSGRERVYSAMESARLMAGAAGSGGTTGGGGGERMVAVQLTAAPGADSRLAQLIEDLVRDRILRLVAVNGSVMA